MEAFNKTTPCPFTYEGHTIATDRAGRISLTDLWKAAGAPQNKEIKDWLRLSSTEGFIAAASKYLKVDKSHLLVVKRGRSGGTYGDKQLALEYAQYADPKLALAVNQIFFERIEEESNPELAVERANSTWRKWGKDEAWIDERNKGIAARKHFTSTLEKHGVEGFGYSTCTNNIYRALCGGDAKQIKESKNLPAGANPRDAMSKIELAGVGLAELVAAENIEANKLKGTKSCAFECRRSGELVAQAIKHALEKIA